MSKKAIRILATVVILGGAFITVLVTSMRENTQYYKHVDEVMPQAAAWYARASSCTGMSWTGRS